MTVSISANNERGRGLLGKQNLGIEFIDKKCWKCGQRLFVVSGVITTEPDCEGWSRYQWASGDWRIRDFYALYQFDDNPASQLAAAIAELELGARDWLVRKNVRFAGLERRFIKRAGERLWTSYCSNPKCRMTDGPAKLIEEERPVLVGKWRANVLAQTLIYRGVVIDFTRPQSTYEAIKGHSILHRRIEGD